MWWRRAGPPRIRRPPRWSGCGCSWRPPPTQAKSGITRQSGNGWISSSSSGSSAAAVAANSGSTRGVSRRSLWSNFGAPSTRPSRPQKRTVCDVGRDGRRRQRTSRQALPRQPPSPARKRCWGSGGSSGGSRGGGLWHSSTRMPLLVRRLCRAERPSKRYGRSEGVVSRKRSHAGLICGTLGGGGHAITVVTAVGEFLFADISSCCFRNVSCLPICLPPDSSRSSRLPILWIRQRPTIMASIATTPIAHSVSPAGREPVTAPIISVSSGSSLVAPVAADNLVAPSLEALVAVPAASDCPSTPPQFSNTLACLPPRPSIQASHAASCLVLSGRGITQLRGFAAVPGVSELWVDHNQLGSFSGLEPLTRLRCLFAAHNVVESFAAQRHFLHVEELDLANNSLVGLDAVLAELGKLTRLTHLWLGGNPCATESGYRARTIAAACDFLSSLDNELVIADERAAAVRAFGGVSTALTGPAIQLRRGGRGATSTSRATLRPGPLAEADRTGRGALAEPPTGSSSSSSSSSSSCGDGIGSRRRAFSSTAGKRTGVDPSHSWGWTASLALDGSRLLRPRATAAIRFGSEKPSTVQSIVEGEARRLRVEEQQRRMAEVEAALGPGGGGHSSLTHKSVEEVAADGTYAGALSTLLVTSLPVLSSPQPLEFAAVATQTTQSSGVISLPTPGTSAGAVTSSTSHVVRTRIFSGEVTTVSSPSPASTTTSSTWHARPRRTSLSAGATLNAGAMGATCATATTTRRTAALENARSLQMQMHALQPWERCKLVQLFRAADPTRSGYVDAGVVRRCLASAADWGVCVCDSEATSTDRGGEAGGGPQPRMLAGVLAGDTTTGTTAVTPAVPAADSHPKGFGSAYEAQADALVARLLATITAGMQEQQLRELAAADMTAAAEREAAAAVAAGAGGARGKAAATTSSGKAAASKAAIPLATTTAADKNKPALAAPPTPSLALFDYEAILDTLAGSTGIYYPRPPSLPPVAAAPDAAGATAKSKGAGGVPAVTGKKPPTPSAVGTGGTVTGVAPPPKKSGGGGGSSTTTAEAPPTPEKQEGEGGGGGGGAQSGHPGPSAGVPRPH